MHAHAITTSILHGVPRASADSADTWILYKYRKLNRWRNNHAETRNYAETHCGADYLLDATGMKAVPDIPPVSSSIVYSRLCNMGIGV